MERLRRDQPATFHQVERQIVQILKLIDPDSYLRHRLAWRGEVQRQNLLVTWSAVATGIYSRQIVTMTSLLAVPFGLAAATGITGWNLVLVSLLRRYRDRFPKALLKWFIRGMGMLLMLIALWSGISLVRAYV